MKETNINANIIAAKTRVDTISINNLNDLCNRPLAFALAMDWVLND